MNLSSKRGESGELTLSWTRRSRDGFAWIDGIDAPLGETREQYQVNLIGSAGSLEVLSAEPALTVAAMDLAPLGIGDLRVEVRQIGDAAASRPTQLSLTLS